MHHLWQKPGMAPRHWLNSCGRAEQPWTPEEVFTTAQTPPPPKIPHDPDRFGLTEAGRRPWNVNYAPRPTFAHYSSALNNAPLTFPRRATWRQRRRTMMPTSWNEPFDGVISPKREMFPVSCPPPPPSPWWEFWFRTPASGPLVWNINRSSRLACILFKMSTTRSQQIAKSVMKKWKKWEKLLGEVSLAARELKMIVTANVGSY